MLTSQTLAYAATERIFYIASWVFFTYFIIVTIYYSLLAIMGIGEGNRRMMESEDEAYPLLFSTAFTLPVSIIMPAHNEEEWIADAVGSVLRLDYPEFEVIIVDDQSADKTFDILNSMLELENLDATYLEVYEDGRVSEILKSIKYPHVTVIRKCAGFKKAGAINAGLNLARYKYICVMDGDTVLEKNALLQLMAHVQKDPEHVVAIGSYFGLSNGFIVKAGVVVERKFSYNPLIAYQNLEYIRSFIGTRIAWSRMNATPIVPGGFGLWRRDIVSAVGGFDKAFSSEDLEFAFRVRRYLVENNMREHKMLMMPYFAGWTQGPGDVKSLISQRNRWQRVTAEAVWKYRDIVLNASYGSFGFAVFPYYIIYEVFGVFFEIGSFVMAFAGWALGILSLKLAGTMLCFIILCQAIVSLLSIFVFLRGQIPILFPAPYVLYLVVLSFLEIFWYRWIILCAKIAGIRDSVKGVRGFNQYVRSKRSGEDPGR